MIETSCAVLSQYEGHCVTSKFIAFITFKISSKPFYFLSAIKFPIMKVQKMRTQTTRRQPLSNHKVGQYIDWLNYLPGRT